MALTLILLFIVLLYGGYRLIRWITKPSYWHEYDGGYYITGNRNLTEKEKKKIQKLKEKRY